MKVFVILTCPLSFVVWFVDTLVDWVASIPLGFVVGGVKGTLSGVFMIGFCSTDGMITDSATLYNGLLLRNRLVNVIW